MGPFTRRLALFAHVLVSVGFPGAVAGFFALALLALNSPDAIAYYRALEPLTDLVILPLAFVTLATGVVSSLATPWGLFRHYWVALKFWSSLAASAILVLHLTPIATLAHAETLTPALTATRLQLVIVSGAALALLTALTLISVLKPRGLTRRGWRLAGR